MDLWWVPVVPFSLLHGHGGTTTSGHVTTLKDKAAYFKMANGSHFKAEIT